MNTFYKLPLSRNLYLIIKKQQEALSKKKLRSTFNTLTKQVEEMYWGVEKLPEKSLLLWN